MPSTCSSATTIGASLCGAWGVRGASLVPADAPVQLGFFSNAEKREKLERLDKAVDVVRERYGYTSVQRARIYTDRGWERSTRKTTIRCIRWDFLTQDN